MRNSALSAEDHQVLAAWDIGDVISARVPETGSVNRTVIVDSERGRFVLRVSKRGQERIEWEHACINWAADSGLPVCRPIPFSGSHFFLQQDDQFFALFPFAAGQQIGRGALNSEQARAAGACLASIHAAFQEFPAQRVRVKNLNVDVSAALAAIPVIVEAIHAQPIRTETDEAALAQLAGRYDWLQHTGHLAAGVHERLMALPQMALHGDYQETNLFFLGNEVAAVIDWDQSGLAARGWEVLRVLHLMFGLAPDRCRDFLDGYRNVLAFPNYELKEAAAVYGVLADSNLWVYSDAYLAGNTRARQFIRHGPFIPFQSQWEASGLPLQ